MTNISKYTDYKLIRIYYTLIDELESENDNLVIKTYKYCIKVVEEEMEKRKLYNPLLRGDDTRLKTQQNHVHV